MQISELPSNVYAERMLLGSILLNGEAFLLASAKIGPEDFSLAKHRVMFRRMAALHEAGQQIDRVTLANELMRHGELESVDGLTYLSSLDNGLPEIYHLESYAEIVRESSVGRQAIMAAAKLQAAISSGVESPQQSITDAAMTFMALGESHTSSGLVSSDRIIEEAGLDAILNPRRFGGGILTQYRKFDDMTGGLKEGELVIVAGRPAMGKTAFALNIAERAAVRQGKRVAVFSLEMSRNSLISRMVLARAHVSRTRVKNNWLDEAERTRLMEAGDEIHAAPLWIDDSADLKLADMHVRLRRLIADAGVDLVIVDYLQLMVDDAGRRGDNRVQEVGRISRGLKLLAKQLHVPVIALSQLSRGPENRPGDHRPKLADLRESGSIEQDADIVLFLFRPEVYQPDREDIRGYAEGIIGKQREGPIGKFPLVFIADLTLFENPVDDICREEESED
jgi:replicative DNA helicase